MPAKPNSEPALRHSSPLKTQPDVAIAGAGVIGLSLALELHRRGASVRVHESRKALQQASFAAAGMLAAEDPHNPSQLLQLARYSVELYPGFLRYIESLGGIRVAFQTEATLQYLPSGNILRLAERSLDPRQLAVALLAAIRNTSIELCQDSTLKTHISCGQMVYATGAWTQARDLAAMQAEVTARVAIPVTPRKGQMLRVQVPQSLPLREVHRSEHVYIVPRTLGEQAGSALIGATVEDAGFDTAVHQRDLDHLRSLAAKLLPALASGREAPLLEAWAGLRPATPDGLPVLGRIGSSSEFVATGHFRNGILLAPATAVLLADLLEGRPPAVDLSAFSPGRFPAR